jgi:hypothetical protein
MSEDPFYTMARIRSEDMMRKAERARLAAEARRWTRAEGGLAGAPGDAVIRPARRLLTAAARLWHRPAAVGATAPASRAPVSRASVSRAPGLRGLGEWAPAGGSKAAGRTR